MVEASIDESSNCPRIHTRAHGRIAKPSFRIKIGRQRSIRRFRTWPVDRGSRERYTRPSPTRVFQLAVVARAATS